MKLESGVNDEPHDDNSLDEASVVDEAPNVSDTVESR